MRQYVSVAIVLSVAALCSSTGCRDSSAEKDGSLLAEPHILEGAQRGFIERVLQGSYTEPVARVLRDSEAVFEQDIDCAYLMTAGKNVKEPGSCEGPFIEAVDGEKGIYCTNKSARDNELEKDALNALAANVIIWARTEKTYEELSAKVAEKLDIAMNETKVWEKARDDIREYTKKLYESKGLGVSNSGVAHENLLDLYVAYLVESKPGGQRRQELWCAK